MGVPANLMKQMVAQGGGGPPGAAPAPGAGAGEGARGMPPAAAPFSTPQDKKGLKASAMANVHIALTLLEQAIPDLGTDTPEGLAVIKAAHGLAKFAAKSDHSDLVPAEIMQMVKAMPQMGGGTPIQQELMRQQAEQRMAAQQKPPGMGAPAGAQ